MGKEPSGLAVFPAFLYDIFFFFGLVFPGLAMFPVFVCDIFLFFCGSKSSLIWACLPLPLSNQMRGRRLRCPLVAGFTTQFTCFPSTKVQILTPEELRGRRFRSALAAACESGWQPAGQNLCFCISKNQAKWVVKSSASVAACENWWRLAGGTTQLTCFTSTKIQILIRHWFCVWEQATCSCTKALSC